MQIPSIPTTAVVVVGRIGLASLFVLGGLNKLISYSTTLEQMENAGLSPAALLLPLVIVLEFCGGIAIAYGKWKAVLASCLLAGFTLTTNFVFHDFWNMAGERSVTELALFFKNVAIAGALIYLAGVNLERTSA